MASVAGALRRGLLAGERCDFGFLGGAMAAGVAAGRMLADPVNSVGALPPTTTNGAQFEGCALRPPLVISDAIAFDNARD